MSWCPCYCDRPKPAHSCVCMCSGLCVTCVSLTDANCSLPHQAWSASMWLDVWVDLWEKKPTQKKLMMSLKMLMRWEQEHRGDWCFGCFNASWLTGWLADCLLHCLVCCIVSLVWASTSIWEQGGEDEEAVSGCLLMVRSMVSSTDSGLSPMTLGPLHITGHNSTHLAVWGLRGLGIKSVERPNGRRRDQLRALLTRSPQENISGADPGNYNDPLATEQGEQAG